jgi:hypothetical protein
LKCIAQHLAESIGRVARQLRISAAPVSQLCRSTFRKSIVAEPKEDGPGGNRSSDKVGR